jgi:hypothetical protein
MEFEKIKVVAERRRNITKTAHYAMEEPNFAIFPNKKAMEIIRDVACFILENKAGKLSEITHDTVYENTRMGGVIPIESVYSVEICTEPWTNNEKEAVRVLLEEMVANGEVDLSEFC